MKFKVHLPEDMTEIYKKMNQFKAEKIIRECTPQQVEAIIKYLEEKQGKEDI
ncbi:MULTISPECIES: hypothetical protein [unclassified Clostridium]|uniref:hypothetical protein n=1 Tax=unclassified Clostridium TaxID=2614128 RepID=UPI0002985C09|nr:MULTISPECIES: hypothetical protein [unclassified Clostridium]EKQ56324.1 MAG: hypothetical protein A370_02080 [Clostridium sp. Maddingley MBC34-26]